MSATNQTAVYGLPIFLGTDVPSWLTDWNGAMGDIDTAIAAAKAAADAAASTAGTAATDIVTINGQITTLQNTVGTHTSQIGTISGNINTINSLIGNGTPTTTDQTIIGAINEINARVSANVFDTVVDLTQYDASTPYEAPTDGYVRTLVSGASQDVSVTIKSHQGNMSAGISASYNGNTDMRTVFVKKGMFLYGSITGSATCLYFPFE